MPTLKEIVPYREALVIYEYEVLEVLGGELGDETVRVAHAPEPADEQWSARRRRHYNNDSSKVSSPFCTIARN